MFSHWHRKIFPAAVAEPQHCSLSLSDRLFFDPRGHGPWEEKEEELEEVRKQAQYIEPLDTWILVDWRWIYR